MNVLYVTVLFVAVAVAGVQAVDREQMKEMFRSLSQECKEQVKASESDVEDLINHKEELSGPAKCLKACMMKKFKMMTDDGKLSIDGMTEMARMLSENNEEMVKVAGEIAEKCAAAAVPDDPCEAAQVYNKCMMAELKERGLFEKFGSGV